MGGAGRLQPFSHGVDMARTAKEMSNHPTLSVSLKVYGTRCCSWREKGSADVSV